MLNYSRQIRRDQTAMPSMLGGVKGNRLWDIWFQLLLTCNFSSFLTLGKALHFSEIALGASE
jgi:hypothetical protein